MVRIVPDKWKAAATAALCLHPTIALAEDPVASGGDFAAAFGLLMSFPLMLVFTLAYLFSGRSWLMVLALICTVTTFFSILVFGLVSDTFTSVLLVASLFSVLLLFLKRADLRRPVKKAVKTAGTVPDDHPCVRSWSKPVFYSPGE